MAVDIYHILNEYETKISISSPNEMYVSPRSGDPGLPFMVQGNFAQLESTEIVAVSFDGYVQDVADQDIEPEFNLKIIRALLEGNFSYRLVKRNLWDKLAGGTVYLNVGPADNLIISNYRCVSQSYMKDLLDDNFMPQAYKRKLE